MEKEIMAKLRAGATVKVHERIKEGDKERDSVFHGLIIARKHGSEVGATITVRTTIGGVGVEKIYPLHSPAIAKIEIVSATKKVRRSKLYFLRDLSKRGVRQKVGV